MIKLILLALLSLTAAQAGAQQRVPAYGPRTTISGHGGNFGGHFGGGRHRGGKFHGGFFPGYILLEREVPVVIEREVIVREVPAAAPAPAAPPPAPRQAYVLGRTYRSLPDGCMKMIQGSQSYYRCDGDWYRQTGSGGGVRYLAVAAP